ncbi:MAG: protein-L-isoaspartate O-methyltransferase family protein, partial [Noviherbaspirillum sp.]
MSSGDKRFPLPLSSVVDKSSKIFDRRSSGAGTVATPQTATQNAARNVKRTTQETELRSKLPAVVALPRQTPLVSDAVRSAMVARVAKQGVKDAKVLAAMEAVPRHLFIEPALASQAYIDASLPIGHHQTISQPYIVARMIEVLRTDAPGGALN